MNLNRFTSAILITLLAGCIDSEPESIDEPIIEEPAIMDDTTFNLTITGEHAWYGKYIVLEHDTNCRIDASVTGAVAEDAAGWISIESPDGRSLANWIPGRGYQIQGDSTFTTSIDGGRWTTGASATAGPGPTRVIVAGSHLIPNAENSTVDISIDCDDAIQFEVHEESHRGATYTAPTFEDGISLSESLPGAGITEVGANAAFSWNGEGNTTMFLISLPGGSLTGDYTVQLTDPAGAPHSYSAAAAAPQLFTHIGPPGAYEGNARFVVTQGRASIVVLAMDTEPVSW